ncbi:MAG: hypothetical protein HC882_01465 [Acidobacteria bacterium]|nr:hypothetical protein [Acidobacteriota bacterium]
MRTKEHVFGRIGAYAAGNQTVGLDGVVGKIVPGASATSGSTTTFAPPPYATRLRINTFDTGSDSSALTCSSCVIGGFNSLGFQVSETVSTIAEATVNLTTNSYEEVNLFRCSGCANMAAGDTVVAASTEWLGLDVPIRRASDVDAVCFTEFDDPATAWTCVSGARCTIHYPSYSIEADSCRVLGGLTLAWTLTDNGTIRVRARAAPVVR